LIQPQGIAWRRPAALALAACVPLLLASSIVVVPSGMGAVRVSQIRGTLPGTLYPGMHFITPWSTACRLLTSATTSSLLACGRRPHKNGLSVQSREGLNIGLTVTVRYRLDPNSSPASRPTCPSL